MSLNEKESKVIELLKNGKSYTFIQDQLQVSPTKIALLKRMHLPSDDVICDNSGYDSSSDSAISSAGSATTATTEFDDNSTNYHIVDENKRGYDHSNSINQTKNRMSQNKNYYGKSKSEVEKLKLQLDHKIALKKMALEKEALEIRRKELQLKSSALNNDQQKIEKEGKALIFRFRKLISKLKSGTWTFQQINDYYHNAVSLNEEIEEYCFKEDIDTDGLKILSILSSLVSTFEGHVEEINEYENLEGLDENEVDMDEDDVEDDDEEDDDDLTPTTLEIIVDKFQEIKINEAQSFGFDDYE